MCFDIYHFAWVDGTICVKYVLWPERPSIYVHRVSKVDQAFDGDTQEIQIWSLLNINLCCLNKTYENGRCGGDGFVLHALNATIS